MRTECVVASCSPGLRAAGWFVLIAVAFSGCQKPPVTEAPPPPDPVAATPIPVAPKVAAPQPKVAQATPAPSHLAPPGVFFLVTKVSVETATGITGLPPGTLVRQVTPIEYTTDAGQKLTLRPDQITNDLRVARQVAGADAATQAALRQATAPRRAPAATTSAATPTPAPAATPAATASLQPAPAAAPRATTTSMGANGSLGSTHSRVKEGWLWNRTPDGHWYKVRPVR